MWLEHSSIQLVLDQLFRLNYLLWKQAWLRYLLGATENGSERGFSRFSPFNILREEGALETSCFIAQVHRIINFLRLLGCSFFWRSNSNKKAVDCLTKWGGLSAYPSKGNFFLHRVWHLRASLLAGVFGLPFLSKFYDCFFLFVCLEA